MIVRWEDKEPRMDPSVRMAESAAGVGEGTGGAGVSVWCGGVGGSVLKQYQNEEEKNIVWSE